MTAPARSSGLVLAGAAALGAYEVGVLWHLVEDVASEVPGSMPSVMSGTSAGAINATALAAHADAPARGVELLVRSWSELRLGQVLRPSAIELISMMLDVTGAPLRLRRALQLRSIRGGLLEQTPITTLVRQIPFARLDEHIASGRLRGLAVSATRVASGVAVIFLQTTKLARPWAGELNLIPVATAINADHVLASTAIPLLFPTIKIDGETYCDGGLRQIVPLAPAIHLGAERLLVVNPLRGVSEGVAPNTQPAPVTSPLYLAGKAINALFADRVEADLARLVRTNEILRAGERRFGPTFEREINLELTRNGGPPLRTIDAMSLEPSLDLGALAADHVKSRTFERHVSGGSARLMRCIADSDPSRMGDLLAFLMFDGSFTSMLIDLGRSDARARHDELCALLDPTSGPRTGSGTMRPAAS